jgi:hypothetical protein
MIRHAIAVLSAAAVSLAPASHADEQSYLADLQARGVPVVNPSLAVSGGFRVCGEIRGGESLGTAANTFGILSPAWGPGIVDAAQHNLCPDTLH